MERPKLNFLAIFVATVIWFVAGALWYSPMMFGDSWSQMTGVTKEMMSQVSPLKMDLLPFVAYLIACYVLAHAVAYAGAKTAAMGAVVGFWNWLGFVAAIMFVGTMFQNKPITLWLIDSGYQLVGFLVAGIILASWQPKTVKA